MPDSTPKPSAAPARSRSPFNNWISAAGGVLAVGALFLPSPLLAWVCCALALPDAWLMFVAYGWFHNSMRFDLVSLPR